jgi:hypothetical protein
VPDNHIFLRLREPFHDTTRKVRRNLLIFSALGIIATKIGLVPSKFAAFGVEFTYSNQQSLLTFLAIVIGYFLVSFIVYVYSEYSAWKVLLAATNFEEVKRKIENVDVVVFGTVGSERIETQPQFLNQQTMSTFLFRLVVIEISIPVFFAIYTCISLMLSEPLQAANPSEAVKEEVANKSMLPTAKASAD